MNYEAVIGLEIHVQLNTKSKTFCSCSTSFGEKPNTHTCPVCLGLPGALPVLNREALHKAILAGLALNCEVAEYSVFARKNYFYPDLPKAYQISQYEYPINKGGYVIIKDANGEKKRIGITRAHLEEDAGKLMHDEDPRGPSYVDLNRCGTPLLEIVSEPDMRTPDEAYEFLQAIKEIMQYIGVSECNMEKGELRVDVNISVRPYGQKQLGIKHEIKNMNSFANVKRALEYEIKRQIKVIRTGGKLRQETRLFDQSKNATIPMRTKEEAHDYRYFPDPDLVPVVLKREEIESIRRELPELPEAKRKRFIEQYKLTEYDAVNICSSKKLADYFEEAVKGYKNPKKIANWILSEMMRVVKEGEIDISKFIVKPSMLRELFNIIDSGLISGKIAKEVYEEMVKTGKKASTIVNEKGLKQVVDKNEIEMIVNDVIKENQAVIEDIKKGKKNAFGFLMGQIMKKTEGKANPKLANEILNNKLKQIQ